jgi:hypothetical protein
MIAASLYDWLVFGHIVAAMVWVGSAVLFLALAVVTVRGDAPAARRQLVRWLWGNAAIVLLLLAIAWDMVFKPGL